MRRLIAYALACWACASEGRRSLQSQDKAGNLKKSSDDSFERLAELLFAQGPAAAVRPATAKLAATSSGNRGKAGNLKMAATVEPPTNEYVGKREDSGRSYKDMYEEIFSGELDPSKPVQKPSPDAQAREPTSKRIPFSKVYGTRMRNVFRNRDWTKRDKGRAIFFALVHGLGFLAPFYFSWRMFMTQFIIYCFSALGITYSYHRQLAHKSFKSKKWLEYLMATWGMMGMQGAPIDWASEHRYHHLHTETPYDPHSIWEGFYWAHMGWLLDAEKKEERCADMSNAMDMQKQAFYRFTHKYYKLFVLAHWSLFYAIGGTAGLLWRAFFVMVQYHVTWFVNSASHLWGKQEYNSMDNSRNNWWVGFLAFGEGWHNNHHAFEYSARHGLRPHQLDMTWMTIRFFEKLGLVSGVKLPTERNKERLRINKETA
jgi:stearoyl-CoA desaturase (delta-9 desaturase)